MNVIASDFVAFKLAYFFQTMFSVHFDSQNKHVIQLHVKILNLFLNCSLILKKIVNIKENLLFLGGGTGFIGTAFQYLLKSKGYKVTVISRMPGPQRRSWVSFVKIK